MNEVILCKYGELILKGGNRAEFEHKLMKQLRIRAKRVGNYKISYCQSTVFIEPQDEDAEANIDEMDFHARHVFGFAGVTRAYCCEKSMDAILGLVKKCAPEKLAGVKTFKADARRSDKSFPLPSPEIAGEVGAAVLSCVPRIKVDLYHPEKVVRVEIREQYAYIHFGQDVGAGGMPYTTSGKGLLLLSGGIDSPVAGFMMAKRGVEIEAVHFESFPYTSERAREKVFSLAKILTDYTMRIRIHVISLTHIQELLRDNCDEEYFTLLLRRYMMALALKVAKANDLECIITGESLGQVASQTMKAISVVNEMSDLPIFRPLIGMDKEEIVQIARKIGTMETSILPYEDCCTVFTPRHPKTRPTLSEVLEQQNRLNFEKLVEEAYQTEQTTVIKFFGNDIVEEKQ